MFQKDGTTYTFSTVSDCKDATCIVPYGTKIKGYVDQEKEMDDSCFSVKQRCAEDNSKCKYINERCLVNTKCSDNAPPGTGQGCKKSCDGHDLCGCHPDNGKCYKGNEDPRCNGISNG